jgi:hypothetical protein
VKIEIRYAADYRYAERVSLSPHVFRVIPKVDRYLKVRSFDFRSNRSAAINWRRDIFDNEIASVFYPEHSRVMRVRFRLKLEIEAKNAFGFLLESRALDMPFAYQPEELHILSPYLSSAPAPVLGFWTPPTVQPADRRHVGRLEFRSPQPSGIRATGRRLRAINPGDANSRSRGVPGLFGSPRRQFAGTWFSRAFRQRVFMRVRFSR